MNNLRMKFMVVLLLVCSTLKSININYGDVISGNIDITDNRIINNGAYCA